MDSTLVMKILLQNCSAILFFLLSTISFAIIPYLSRLSNPSRHIRYAPPPPNIRQTANTAAGSSFKIGPQLWIATVQASVESQA
ncbi:hypothetical protein N5P37_001307 [Trichoderma harzianum]|uniref:Uncharacterized protein n=1 Tax=Trichoderma harzianum CBS 226.95 TaxID=983964 RepID=A0A2T4ARL4_TRIHA|nr:hypothetical protein M431DRAFT_504666 [Trichoderma harzianum CBS 226.95]KAK0765379.1 hypothetical protein N5P37_001307 [Trichoderma harzianum]PTB59702.1 hypothetical protein M431DRAFT_504666 [Trichoderma harzianum CBS 226.95]